MASPLTGAPGSRPVLPHFLPSSCSRTKLRDGLPELVTAARRIGPWLVLRQSPSILVLNETKAKLKPKACVEHSTTSPVVRTAGARLESSASVRFEMGELSAVSPEWIESDNSSPEACTVNRFFPNRAAGYACRAMSHWTRLGNALSSGHCSAWRTQCEPTLHIP